MKHEWRKHEKELYLPKSVELIDVPEHSFLILEGEGNPNSELFGQQLEALYSVSYGIRMALKKEDFVYTVYPLEGVWTTSDGSRNKTLNKDKLVYRIMIRQPKQVTKELVASTIEITFKKRGNLFIKELTFETYTEGISAQMIHVGSFDTESETFEKMDTFLEETAYEKDWMMESYVHREIYLSDARKVAPEKRKTLLRYKLKEKK